MEANPRSKIHKSVKWTWRSPLNNFAWKKKLKFRCGGKNRFSILRIVFKNVRYFSDCQILRVCFRRFRTFSEILKMSDFVKQKIEILRFLCKIVRYFSDFQILSNIFDIISFKIFSKFRDFSDFVIFKKFQIVQQNKLKKYRKWLKNRGYSFAHT